VAAAAAVAGMYLRAWIQYRPYKKLEQLLLTSAIASNLLLQSTELKLGSTAGYCCIFVSPHQNYTLSGLLNLSTCCCELHADTAAASTTLNRKQLHPASQSPLDATAGAVANTLKLRLILELLPAASFQQTPTNTQKKTI
jgi:hypothetical protein